MSSEEEPRLDEVLKGLKVQDFVIQTVATLVNLAALRLQEQEREQARLAIDAARALVPLCPEEVSKQLLDPLSQLQIAFVQAQQEQ